MASRRSSPFGASAAHGVLERTWPVLLGAAGVVFVVMGFIDPGAGVVGLELAGTPQRAASAMAEFDIVSARIQTGIDYLFMALLGAGLTGGVRRGWGASAWEARLVGITVLYVLCDAIENVGLLVLLSDPDAPGAVAAGLTAGAAAVKFAALTVSVVALAVGLVRRRRAPAPRRNR